MKTLVNILRELAGLFIDDGLLALASLGAFFLSRIMRILRARGGRREFANAPLILGDYPSHYANPRV
jgi:hypothetical protein